MKKLEKLSNEVFATLEKSEMNMVLGGKNISTATTTWESEHNDSTTTPDSACWTDGLVGGVNDGKWVRVSCQ